MMRTALHVPPAASALLLACSTCAYAADLVDVFRLAQPADATYGAARATWAAAQERIPQARAGLLPSASIATGLRRAADTTSRRAASAFQ
jgi:outer membrane protein